MFIWTHNRKLQKTVAAIIALVIISITYFQIVYDSDDKERLETYTDIVDNYKCFQLDNGMFRMIAAHESSYSDYNTLYGNLLLHELNGNIDKDLLSQTLCGYIDNSNSNKNNSNKVYSLSVGVFEGIEWPYSLYLLDVELNLGICLDGLAELVTEIVENTYRDEGFFLPPEYDYLKTQPDQETLSLILS